MEAIRVKLSVELREYKGTNRNIDDFETYARYALA